MKIFCGLQSGSFVNRDGKLSNFCSAYICDSLKSFTNKEGREFKGFGVRADSTDRWATKISVKNPDCFSGVPFGASIGYTTDEYGRIVSVTVKNPYPFFTPQDAETCLELATVAGDDDLPF